RRSTRTSRRSGPVRARAATLTRRCRRGGDLVPAAGVAGGGMTGALLDEIRRQLPAVPGPDDLRHLAQLVRNRSGPTGTDGVWDTVGRLAGEVLGAGPLEDLLRDDDVTDVLVNGPGEVWIDRGRGVEPSGLVLRDESTIRA